VRQQTLLPGSAQDEALSGIGPEDFPLRYRSKTPVFEDLPRTRRQHSLIQPEPGHGRVPRQAASAQLFFDACSLTGEVTQIVELGAAHITTTLHFYLGHQRRIRGKNALHPFTVGDFADRESRVQATITAGNANNFKNLESLAVALLHFHVNGDRVTRTKSRQFRLHLFLINFVNDVHAQLLSLVLLRFAALTAILFQ
jgi:hypothetical protein